MDKLSTVGGFLAVRVFTIPEGLAQTKENVEAVTRGLCFVFKRFIEGGRRGLALGRWYDRRFSELPRELHALLEEIIRERLAVVLVRGYGEADSADGYRLELKEYFAFCQFDRHPEFEALALDIVEDSPPLVAAGVPMA
ncbi:hypothetical protein EPN90_04975 [Patescibacteria group bacterium]|nr:MAG: hypothetical protein EPN90_04975 [Patescibacteria group bacterium]